MCNYIIGWEKMNFKTNQIRFFKVVYFSVIWPYKGNTDRWGNLITCRMILFKTHNNHGRLHLKIEYGHVYIIFISTRVLFLQLTFPHNSIFVQDAFFSYIFLNIFKEYYLKVIFLEPSYVYYFDMFEKNLNVKGELHPKPKSSMLRAHLWSQNFNTFLKTTQAFCSLSEKLKNYTKFEQVTRFPSYWSKQNIVCSDHQP